MYHIYTQEYEELSHKLNDFKEREKELRIRLKNYCPRQNLSESEENSSATMATKQKPTYNQNLNSPLPKTSPHQILQPPLISPSSNQLHNPDQNGANANNVNNNLNPNIETTEEHTSDLTSKFLIKKKLVRPIYGRDYDKDLSIFKYVARIIRYR